MTSDPQPQPDPWFFDAERLQSLASAAIVRRGIAYFKENRVLDLSWDAERISAAVEGTDKLPYQVDISLDDDHELAIECDCPFDWEPACKHSVAVLLAYASRQPVDAFRLQGAADSAIAARAQRGRSEVVVKHLSGDRWQGTWEATSLSATAEHRTPWQVELRSVHERINHCACPDFATNRLGTCKHIEAVLHTLRKGAPKKFARLAESGPPLSVVHVDWEASAAPRLRLRRADDGGPDWLDTYFDSQGTLRGDLPEAFQRLEQRSRQRPGLMITEEARRLVLRRAEEETRSQRSAMLAARIRASDGELEGVSVRLYPYQVDGVAFLASARRAVLADDMGLGKTLQAIAAGTVLRQLEGVRRILVICPASLKHQWAREVERFTELEAVVVQGTPPARLSLYRRRAPFTMVNYEVVLRDRDVIQSELAPDLIILDEAQRIKNWRTKTAAAVKSLESPFAFVLTGTPLENRLEDLYSLMQVVDARVLGPLWRYLLDFHITDDRGRVLGYRNLAELRRRLASVMLRRDKSLVRDQLPERIVNRVDIELDRRQRDLHDEAVNTAGRIAQIMRKRPLTPAEEKRLMKVLQFARMACDAAGLVDGETVGSPKLSELATLLEQVCVDSGRKVVVFSHWERMTRMAAEEAQRLGLGVVRLHGSVPTHRRGALIDRFRDDPATQVLVSTDAGGVGLNLQAASVLINLDLPWNPAVLEQRIGRLHRLGQSEPVQVFLLVARESYEEHIAGLIGSKKELFRNVVTDEATDDVVGVSKRLVEAALGSLKMADDDEDLEESVDRKHTEPDDATPTVADAATDAATDTATDTAADDDLAPEALTEDPLQDPIEADPGVPAEDPTMDDSLAPLIIRLQDLLGARLQQIVALSGSLVAVVDTLDAQHEAQVQMESRQAEVPVALLDARNWAALSGLSGTSPLAAGRVLFDAAASGTAISHAERLGRQAHGKLTAAQQLAPTHAGEALALATDAMILAITASVGLTSPPPLDQVAVWMHAELVPTGHLDMEAAFHLSRALALRDATEVPPQLVERVLHDAAALVPHPPLASASA